MDCPPEPPLTAYRIADGRRRLFDGTGAALHGGRWSSPGTPVIYAAITYGGAMLEILVRTGIGRIPRHFHRIEIRIPKGIAIECLERRALPGWDGDDLKVPRGYGDAWLSEKRTSVLLVPSVVTRIEYNLLINPAHPEFHRVSASAPKFVVWDERLFART
jgi:RES domain-containing protein